MSRLLAAITLPLSIALTILVTIICSVPIIVAGLIKLLVPIPAGMALYIRFLQFYDVLLVRRAGAAVASQSLAKWDVQGLEGLNKKELVSADQQPPQLGRHQWCCACCSASIFR